MSDIQQNADDKQSIAKALASVSNVILWVLLLPSICLAFTSVFLADIKVDAPLWIPAMGFISMVSSPLVIIVSLVLSRSFYKKQRYVLALVVSLALLLNIGGFFLFNTLMCNYSSQFC